MPGVDARLLRTQLLQAINQSAQAPSPFAVCPVVFEFREETVEVVFTSLMMLTPLTVVVHLCLPESHRCQWHVLVELAGQ